MTQVLEAERLGVSTCQLLEEELSLTEVVTFRAGWLVHRQQLDPVDLLKLLSLHVRQDTVYII